MALRAKAPVVPAHDPADRYWRAIDESLSLPRPASRAQQPQQLRTRLRRLLQRIDALNGAGGGAAVDRLQAIAGGGEPESTADAPSALAEDVAYARCLIECPEETRELASMRAYLDGATCNDGDELATDQAITRERLSFITLLSQPHQLDGMRAAFEVFCDAYARAYVKHHERYWHDASETSASLQEAQPAARALAGLNSLRALGRPLGVDALADYERLRQARSSCGVEGLGAALRNRPACPQCRISMEDAAPFDEAHAVVRRLEAALGRQQSRLAKEAVQRVLARGGERIDQFLRVTQASDVSALAQVLDDALLLFLQELLAEPVAPTPEAEDLFAELARRHPSVGEDDIDAVAETLRTLLRDRLSPNGTKRRTVRLAAPKESR